MLNNKHDITAQSFYDMMRNCNTPKNQVIIDIRTKDEFDAYHLINAINIDFYSQEFSDNIDSLNRKKTYLIYCRTGRRTGTDKDNALKLMLKLGFTKVYNMLGGIHAFTKLPNSDDVIA